jgi:hypothetical protein
MTTLLLGLTVETVASEGVVALQTAVTSSLKTLS